MMNTKTIPTQAVDTLGSDSLSKLLPKCVALMALTLFMDAGLAQINSVQGSLTEHEARRQKFQQMCSNPMPSQRESLEILAKGEGQTLGPAFCSQVEHYYFGRPGRPRDMSGLAFKLRDESIRDISVFQYFAGLQRFGVDKEVKDLSPLIHLKALTDLGIGANKYIIDISVVSNLKNLKHLSLADTQVVSLEPLAGLSNLETLNLHMDRHKGLPGRKGLDVLRHLNNLRQLDMDVEEPLGDQLKDLHKLQGLAVYGPVSDVCSFRDLVNLESLYLKRANIDNVFCLKKLDKLYALVIDGSPVKDISALASLPKLKILSLRNTLVTDLSAFTIQNNVTIGSIDATGAPLRWCSPKTAEDVKKGISCLNPDGTEKSWWKRALRW